MSDSEEDLTFHILFDLKKSYGIDDLKFLNAEYEKYEKILDTHPEAFEELAEQQSQLQDLINHLEALKSNVEEQQNTSRYKCKECGISSLHLDFIISHFVDYHTDGDLFQNADLHNALDQWLRDYSKAFMEQIDFPKLNKAVYPDWNTYGFIDFETHCCYCESMGTEGQVHKDFMYTLKDFYMHYIYHHLFPEEWKNVLLRCVPAKELAIFFTEDEVLFPRDCNIGERFKLKPKPKTSNAQLPLTTANLQNMSLSTKSKHSTVVSEPRQNLISQEPNETDLLKVIMKEYEKDGISEGRAKFYVKGYKKFVDDIKDLPCSLSHIDMIQYFVFNYKELRQKNPDWKPEDVLTEIVNTYAEQPL